MDGCSGWRARAACVCRWLIGFRATDEPRGYWQDVFWMVRLLWPAAVLLLAAAMVLFRSPQVSQPVGPAVTVGQSETP